MNLKNRILPLFKILDKLIIDENEVPPPSIFKEFKQKIIRILFHVPISEDWNIIPNPEIKVDVEHPNCPLKCYKEGITISECENYSEENREKCYEKLNFLYFLNAITFQNEVEMKDYITSSEKIKDFFIPNNLQSQKVIKMFPNLNLTGIIKELSEVVKIHDLIKIYGPNVLNLVKTLYEKEYIRLIDEDERQIYINIDILNDLIKLLLEIINYNEIESKLKLYFKEMSDISISTQFDFEDNKILINKSRMFLDIYTKNELLDLQKKWESLSIKLLQDFYKKTHKKLIPKLHDVLLKEYLPNVHKRDLELLEPFLYLLEDLNN